MSNRTEMERFPKLRFSEFTKSGAVVFVPGNQIFQQISNKNHNADLPILAITQEHGAIPRDAIDYSVSVSENGLRGYKVVEPGDFIISLRSFQGGIEYSMHCGICSPAYIILRKKEDVLEQYYKYYFKTDRFIQDLNKDLEGIRDGKMVSYGQFSAILLPKPSKAEQQRVADCLSSLDELISLEEKKLVSLQEHKKGLMQKLFPAEGKTVPAWRFPEFRKGAWLHKNLSKICDMQAGKFVQASQIKQIQKENMYPCYGGNGLRGYTHSSTHSGAYSLIGRQGALCGNVNYVTGTFHATEHAVVVTEKHNICAKWLYYLLLHLDLNQYATGQAQPGLSVQVLEKIEVYVPKLVDEQKKIANCLASADKLIESQTEKIANLKKHKKGLMQGLFPSIEEVSK